ncbi:MAG: hypothetical protein M3Y37_06785, partial [Chloroflexota bacterium]|nr:hypothetical protein [Chloroflexota bacterium]
SRLDACTTTAEGNCRLAIDYNGTRIFAQDADAIPDGYRAFEDVKRVFTYTEFAEVTFHNYAEGLIQRDAPRATVRVHTRICPERYSGDTFFEDCNPGVPETNEWIFANDQVARAGKDGNAILRSVPAGPGSRIIGGQSHSTGDIFFYCSLTNDPETRVPTPVEVTAQYDGITRDFAGLVDLEPQMDVTCDWYQIPLLDRGLWDTLMSPLAGPDSNVSFPAPAGDMILMLKRCPEGFIPETISGAEDECTTPENGATVRATSESGIEYDSATSNADGAVQISLSDQTVVGPFWVTLDGHANAEPDLVACYSVVFRQENAPEPIQQWATFDGAGWTIDGFGDDAQGYSCTWYLVPTGS